MSPDYSDGPDPIPYADLSDPQTFNLYSYGGNNPLSNTDVDGHCYGQQKSSIWSCIGAFFQSIFGSSGSGGGNNHGDVPSQLPDDFGRQVMVELARRAPAAQQMINFQAGIAVATVAPMALVETSGAGVATLGLNTFSEAEIDVAVESAAEQTGVDSTAGRDAIQSHASRGGPFRGMQKADPGSTIREIMRNPSRVVRTTSRAGNKYIDVFDKSGRGVRLVQATGKFFGFLSK